MIKTNILPIFTERYLIHSYEQFLTKDEVWHMICNFARMEGQTAPTKTYVSQHLPRYINTVGSRKRIDGKVKYVWRHILFTEDITNLTEDDEQEHL
jgi:hypothetical protein